MTDFTKVQQALERRGYTVRTFAAAAEAAAYLDGAIDGKTVGFGGSAPRRRRDWIRGEAGGLRMAVSHSRDAGKRARASLPAPE